MGFEQCAYETAGYLDFIFFSKS